MKAENILIAIAQENGFDTWEQYFECFITTDAGRRVINKDILKAVNQALILSSVVGQTEQLVCEYCNDDAKPTCCDICLERMVNAVQKAN